MFIIRRPAAGGAKRGERPGAKQAIRHSLLRSAALLACFAMCGCRAGMPAERRDMIRNEMHLIDTQAAFSAGTGIRGAIVAGDHVLLYPDNADGAEYRTAAIAPACGFHEAIVSWNVADAAAAALAIELRVGRAQARFWSPWLYVGGVGAAAPPPDAITRFEGGRIDVDYFRSEESYDRAQLRVRTVSAHSRDTPVRVDRLAICFTCRDPDFRPMPTDAAPAPAAIRRLPVPFISQKSLPDEIAGRVCSPTSVAMVMAYRGAIRSPEEVAAAAYDATHDIYGNWPRNVQAAYEFGVPGYLRRFSQWSEVEAAIAAGQPLIISIRVGEPGALHGAPYETTAGHLIVLTGFAENGDVWVNDPAGATPAEGVLRYSRADLEKAWMRGSGGLAYVLLRADRAVSSP